MGCRSRLGRRGGRLGGRPGGLQHFSFPRGKTRSGSGLSLDLSALEPCGVAGTGQRLQRVRGKRGKQGAPLTPAELKASEPRRVYVWTYSWGYRDQRRGGCTDEHSGERSGNTPRRRRWSLCHFPEGSHKGTLSRVRTPVSARSADLVLPSEGSREAPFRKYELESSPEPSAVDVRRLAPGPEPHGRSPGRQTSTPH